MGNQSQHTPLSTSHPTRKRLARCDLGRRAKVKTRVEEDNAYHSNALNSVAFVLVQARPIHIDEKQALYAAGRQTQRSSVGSFSCKASMRLFMDAEMGKVVSGPTEKPPYADHEVGSGRGRVYA